MNILIAIASHHGCTEKVAHMIRDLLKNATVVNLKKDSISNLDEFDAVVIGGSIHAGRIQKQVKSFCEKNISTLLTKKIGLFLCCMQEGEGAQKQFDNSFPEVLRKHSTSNGLFGGEFDFNKMNFIEKFIVKKVSNVKESVSKLNTEAVHEFVNNFK